MAWSASISDMGLNDILLMRIATGINDSSMLEKILAVPREEFHIEEIHRLCVRSESARNFQKHMKPQQQSHYTSKTNYQNKKKEDWANKYGKNNDKRNNNPIKKTKRKKV